MGLIHKCVFGTLIADNFLNGWEICQLVLSNVIQIYQETGGILEAWGNTTSCDCGLMHRSKSIWWDLVAKGKNPQFTPFSPNTHTLAHLENKLLFGWAELGTLAVLMSNLFYLTVERTEVQRGCMTFPGSQLAGQPELDSMSSFRSLVCFLDWTKLPHQIQGAGIKCLLL